MLHRKYRFSQSTLAAVAGGDEEEPLLEMLHFGNEGKERCKEELLNDFMNYVRFL